MEDRGKDGGDRLINSIQGKRHSQFSVTAEGLFKCHQVVVEPPYGRAVQANEANCWYSVSLHLHELSSLFLLCIRLVCTEIIRLIQSVNKCHDPLCPHTKKLPGFAKCTPHFH